MPGHPPDRPVVDQLLQRERRQLVLAFLIKYLQHPGGLASVGDGGRLTALVPVELQAWDLFIAPRHPPLGPRHILARGGSQGPSYPSTGLSHCWAEPGLLSGLSTGRLPWLRCPGTRVSRPRFLPLRAALTVRTTLQGGIAHLLRPP